MAHLELIEQVFHRLVDRLTEMLPDFGASLAVDGKAVESFARGKSKREHPDRRGDVDGEWGNHEYSGTHADGTRWHKVKKWFGYAVHLLVDSQYELSVDFSVTRAYASGILEAHQLLDQLEERHPQVAERCAEVVAGRSYDDGKLTREL
jgi:hypothetical protein